MNTTIANNNTLRGVPRAIWIGGALMGLTIIALATTLVVRSNEPAPDSAAAAPPAATSVVAAPAAAVASAATSPTPVNESTTATAPANPPTAAAKPARPGHHATAAPEHPAAPEQVAAAPVCASCGVIESYSAVQVQGQNNGVGAVAGGVGGALIGSKIAGRGNHTLGGVIGAVGGGLLGNAIETHQRTTTVYDVHVRMNDGTLRTVRQATVPTVGAQVNVEGGKLRAATTQG